MSQGGVKNDDTHRKFETTDMWEWMFQRPKCGTWQPLDTHTPTNADAPASVVDTPGTPQRFYRLETP